MKEETTEPKSDLKVEYVDTEEKLQQCVHYLRSVKELAFDLEFDRNKYTYGFNLCLVQVATADRCFIIDPLAKIQLDELFQLFEDPSILKVVHSPGEDLRLLHSLKCYPKNIFDIQIAAKLLNHEKISLANLIESATGIISSKKQQTSNWGKRPLTEAQILYSANDVIYLLQLKDVMLKEAKLKNIESFIEEEFRFLETTIHSSDPTDNFLKDSEIASLSDYHQFVLNELLKFRDGRAQRHNKPPAWIFPNDLIRDMAFGKVNLSSFFDWKGVYAGIKNQKFKDEFQKKWDGIMEEAAGMSKKSKAKFFGQEERQRLREMKEENEKIRETKFKPIQAEIERQYGANTAKHMLGDGLVGRLLKREAKLSELKEEYRRQVILSAAAALNIDISEYI